MDPAQRRLAERRLLSALARFHRHEPLAPDLRIDAVLALARDVGQRPASHRGAAPLSLTDAELLEVLDELVERGEVERAGHRVRLVGHRPELGPGMRRRADTLLGELRAAGASPPRAEAVARRLGLPDGVLDVLRQSGELVRLGPGIEYPRDALAELLEPFRGRQVTVAEIRDELQTSRRYGAALLEALATEITPRR